ncbi:Protein of unknown function [Lactobacillus acidophilus DSM 20079 = JCM 1132 = NBRC 13951 = CIP 76.13]|nr:Protein of unknown function [Lactobacillus acidophilus DSM 20079 = JCM 1132 = NBRC 13951 = CIP 76.13]CDF68514.1 Protein of unknown function [Lactobacillus acidophilus CIRM-BIA 442]CDF72275.1 Protein of unknown function [Lactobacillus acidophilus CIRM-BIA 445]
MKAGPAQSNNLHGGKNEEQA